MSGKKILLGLGTLVFLGLMAKVPLSEGATLKIGYINIAETFERYYRTHESEKEFQAEKKKNQDEINKQEEKIKLLREELKKKKGVLKKKEITEKEKEITEKTVKLSEFINRANLELREKNARLITERLAEVNEAIKNFGKRKKYSIILEERSIFYGGTNITEEFIKFLNKKK